MQWNDKIAKASIIIATALLLVASPGLGHSGTLLNSVQNGGFENGLDDWVGGGGSNGASVSLTSPGAEGTSTAVSITNYPISSYLVQPLVLQTPPPVTLLDFSAKVVANAHYPTSQNVHVLADWTPTGLGESTVTVRFLDEKVQLRVYCDNNDPLTCTPQQFTETPMPLDGQWHHYQVVLVQPAGIGYLFIDGDYKGIATGDPATVDVPDRIHFGDTACCDRRTGPAPDMLWDEFYFGPL